MPVSEPENVALILNQPEPARVTVTTWNHMGGLALACLALASCTSQPAASSDAGSAEIVESAAGFESAELPKPAPHYVAQIGSIYFYPTDGDPLGFVYQRKTPSGLNIVLMANQFGRAVEFAGCSDPCRVVRLATGETLPFNENTPIGRMFTDIEHGFIKPMLPYPPKTVVAQPSAEDLAHEEQIRRAKADQLAKDKEAEASSLPAFPDVKGEGKTKDPRE